MNYKVCPSCGAKNPEDEIVCKECMADITDVEPVRENVEEEKTIVVSNSIILVGDGFSITVREGDVVGRQGVGTDVLKEFKTVSRKHVKFYREGDKWFIEDMESTNGTFLNGKPLQAHQKYELRDGDEIKLSSQVSLKVKL